MKILFSPAVLIAFATFFLGVDDLRADPLAAAEPIVKKDIPYAKSNDQLQSLDVYAPDQGENHPIIVWIHGGSLTGGDKSGIDDKAQAFAQKGIVTVSTNYRLSPKVTVKEMAGDIARAIRWTHDHGDEFGGDGKRIFVMGFSAGAYLAALVCTDDSYLKAEGLPLTVVSGCVPVDTMIYDINDYFEEWPDRVGRFKTRLGDDKELWRDYSPVHHISKGKNTPPFLILHSDHLDNKNQSHLLADKLKGAGIPARVVAAAEGVKHGSVYGNLGKADDGPTQEIWAFMEDLLKHTKLIAPEKALSARKVPRTDAQTATEAVAEPKQPQPKSAPAQGPELHAADGAVMKQVVGLVGVAAEPKRAACPGGPGFEWMGVHGKAHRLFVLCDAQGRITELRGNGPWLSNEALAAVAKLPELRVIYMDHNIPPPGSDIPHSKFDGTGFSAFRDGKLEWVLIGHALTNEGARALATIPTLKSMHIEHAKGVNGDGIRYFAGHPTLERFAWGCPIRWDEAAFFDTAAALPKVRELVFKDAIATYDGGLARLRPVAGRLRKLELRKTLALPADLDRFRADHPQAEVIAILPEHFEEAATKLKGRMSSELTAWAEAELARLNNSR